MCYFLATVTPPPKPSNPCIPSPCGPYSSCKPLRDRPMCSCKGGYIGAPPNCRPECIINDECNRQQACSNQHCINPCDGACGLNSECTVRNHLPICKCPRGYDGDPFRQCNKITEVIKPTEGPLNPCFPSPCGANARCTPTIEEKLAVVLENILEIHTHSVVQNVFLTLIVQLIEHVLILNV